MIDIDHRMLIRHTEQQFAPFTPRFTMKAPQRREREIARTREDIVEAASRAFTKVGVHDATMQDIAAEAGYTAASLYTYFRSKNEIVEAVMELLTAEFLRAFDEPLPSNLSFAQRLEIIMLRQMEVIEKRRTLMISFHADTGGPCPGGDAHGQSFHQNFERRILGLADWIRKNAKPEEIGGHDPELAARFLVGTAFGFLHESVANAEGKLTDYVPMLHELFFHGVSGSPKAGAKKKMSTTSSKLKIATLVFSLLGAGRAAAEPMSLDQCIETALKRNPDIISANRETDAAEAARKSARGGFGPRVKVDAGLQRWDRAISANLMGGVVPLVNYGITGDPSRPIDMATDPAFAPDGKLASLAKPMEIRPQTTWSASATLVQPLAALWTVKEGYDVRKLGVTVAQVGEKSAQRDVAFQVAEAYYRLIQAMRIADVAQKSVENITAQVKRSQTFFQSGTVGKNDVLRAELGLASAKQRFIQAKGGVELARSRLATLLGLSPETDITPTLALDDVQTSAPMRANDAEDRALKERIELKQIDLRIDQAKGGERLAKSKMIPQLNALATFNLQQKTALNPYDHAWFVGGQASWDIFEGGSTYYGIEESKARLAQSLAAKQKVEDMVRLDARSAQVGLVTATEALQVSRAAVEQAEENFRIEQKRYESADNTSFDVLDAESQLTTARGQHQAAVYEYLIAQSNLARATGQLRPGQTGAL
jgi:outer membrane protein TolC